MASSGDAGKTGDGRVPSVCPVCLKAKRYPVKHLKRSCMKNNSDEEILRAAATAKAAVLDHLMKGMSLDFSRLSCIVTDPHALTNLVSYLEETGHVIRGKKDVISEVAQPQKQPGVTNTRTSEELAEEVEMEDRDGPLCQPPASSTWTTPLRKKMSQSGLYRKHSLECRILAGFKNYLIKEIYFPTCQQEVANVSRFLYFMDPTKPSLQFVRNMEKAREFFVKLVDLGQAKQTVACYMKNLKRFLHYNIFRTNLIHEDAILHKDCIQFQGCLGDMQKTINKQVSREIAGKRYSQLIGKSPTIQECLAVLVVARADLCRIIAKAVPGTPLEVKERLTILYYLEALLMLQHMQRPGVVKNMTVEEWCTQVKFFKDNRNSYIIGVKRHKTGTQQVATVSLNEEEHSWFEVYFTCVRPTFLSNALQVSKEELEQSSFFISTSGRPIYNPSSDLRRFQVKYKVPNITSQVARRALETATKSALSDPDKNLVADYLAHSNATAEKHYRLKTTELAATGMDIIRRMCSTSASQHSDEEASSSSPQHMSAISSERPEDGKVMERFLQAFPVSLDGKRPKKKKREEVAGTLGKACYDKWRDLQQKMRVKDVIDHFPCRKPSEGQVNRYIKRQDWRKNSIKPADVLNGWQPQPSQDSNQDIQKIHKLIKSQKWRGLIILDDPIKGKMVHTTRNFLKGEVVCDYHGIPISHKEGKKLLEETGVGETCYLYFYRNSRGKKCCMDAKTVPCPCHPERETIGRRVNRSGKKANLKSTYQQVKIDDVLRDVIIFTAACDIKVGKKLLYD